MARNPSVDRQVGRPRYDPAGARLVISEITEQQQHGTAHHDFGSVIALWEEPKWDRLKRAISDAERVGQYASILDGKIDRCEERHVLDDFPNMTSFEEVDYFRVYENRFPQ